MTCPYPGCKARGWHETTIPTPVSLWSSPCHVGSRPSVVSREMYGHPVAAGASRDQCKSGLGECVNGHGFPVGQDATGDELSTRPDRAGQLMRVLTDDPRDDIGDGEVELCRRGNAGGCSAIRGHRHRYAERPMPHGHKPRLLHSRRRSRRPCAPPVRVYVERQHLRGTQPRGSNGQNAGSRFPRSSTRAPGTGSVSSNSRQSWVGRMQSRAERQPRIERDHEIVGPGRVVEPRGGDNPTPAYPERLIVLPPTQPASLPPPSTACPAYRAAPSRKRARCRWIG